MTELLTKRYDHLHKDTLITLIQRLEQKLAEEQKVHDCAKRPSMYLVRENVQLREQLTEAKHLSDHYIRCFNYLLSDPEFPPLLVRLRKRLREET